jgi:hypothetical protein
MDAANDNGTDEIAIFGVSLEHLVTADNDGTFVFSARLPADCHGCEWWLFESYPDIGAVKEALLKLEAGADPNTV